MDIMPFPTIRNSNMVDKQTFEVGLTLVPLAVGHAVLYADSFLDNMVLWYSSSYNVK
jgi:hypothetical protein